MQASDNVPEYRVCDNLRNLKMAFRDLAPALMINTRPKTATQKIRDILPKYNRIFLTGQNFGNIVPKNLV
jgi:hypothetical protein